MLNSYKRIPSSVEAAGLTKSGRRWLSTAGIQGQVDGHEVSVVVLSCCVELQDIRFIRRVFVHAMATCPATPHRGLSCSRQSMSKRRCPRSWRPEGGNCVISSGFLTANATVRSQSRLFALGPSARLSNGRHAAALSTTQGAEHSMQLQTARQCAKNPPHTQAGYLAPRRSCPGPMLVTCGFSCLVQCSGVVQI